MADEDIMTADGEEEVQEAPDPTIRAPDLYEAVRLNNTDEAIEMMNQDVPPTYVDETTGWTIINWAAKNGNVKIMKKLLELNVSAPYHEGKKRAAEGGALNAETTKLLQNTPLHLASSKGYPKIVWLLLIDGYSPDDRDVMGNTCLHLAAAAGSAGILQVLVEDGANPFVFNVYKNKPLDVATKQDTKKVLDHAMKNFKAIDMTTRNTMHMNNLNRYTDSLNKLSEAVSEASKVEGVRSFRQVANLDDTIEVLNNTLTMADKMGLDDDQYQEGKRLQVKLQHMQNLITAVTEARKNTPVKTQQEYIDHIEPLEKAIIQAERAGVDRSHIQQSRDIVVRSQVEHLLNTSMERLQNVTAATNANEQDMMKMKHFIQKAQALQASDEIVDVAVARLKCLESELEMSRAILAVPVVKLPLGGDAPIPDDYWGEDDVGSILETEEYPLPPPDNNDEYIWTPAVSYSKLQASVDRLKSCTNGADVLGANPDIITAAKDKLVKVEKDLKLLSLKEEEDKRIAIEVATKAAKKLKKGKKGKK